jgi:hypothetical protein
MGRDVHRKLLRHVPEDAFASQASAAGAFDAPGTYAVQYHFFSPDPSSLDGARETSSFRDNPRVSSSSSHAASASGAASTVSVFMFILVPVVFLVHCCCCGTRADAFDPGGVDGHWGRRRRRVGARERRGRLAGGPSRGGTAPRDDDDDDGFDLEGVAAFQTRGSRTTANDDSAGDARTSQPALFDDETPGPASNATIKSLPRCTAGDDDWASLLVDGAHDVAACLVCCEDIERGQDVRVMACAHAFHAACIRTWLKVSGSCPACRHPATKLAAEDREAFWRARRRASPSEARSPPPSRAEGDDVDGDGEDASAGDAETRRKQTA